MQVEPRVAVQWPITLDPAGEEDKGLPLGASPPGELRISHQSGMVLVSQSSAEVSICVRIRIHPPSPWGVDSGSIFMSMRYPRAWLQVGGSTSLQAGVLVVEPPDHWITWLFGLMALVPSGYLIGWPSFHHTPMRAFDPCDHLAIQQMQSGGYLTMG